jgi:hypothetical protein
MENKGDGENMALELLKEVKLQSKRWFLAFVITLVLLFASNISWLYVFQSYDYVSQDGEGYNYYNNEVEGGVVNGSENTFQEESQNETWH